MSLFPRYEGPALIEQVCSVANLTRAWQRVRSNIQVGRRGRSSGSDAVTLRDFEADWSRQMAQLADELRSGSYRPLPPRRALIPKASGGERAIAILAVRDRVAQRAVQQVLDPIFDPLFLDCSYGCRPGVGVPGAVARVARYAEQGLTWVVDADISTYFDMIDQRILLSLVRQRIDDVAVLRLLAQWLAAGVLDPTAAPPLPEEAGPSLLSRSGEVLRGLFEGGHLPDPQLPPDPYAAAAWERPASAQWPWNGSADGWYGGMPPSDRSPYNRIWTAFLLAKPILAGAKQALPYVRRFGGRKIVIAGAVAAAAAAAGELAWRAREPGGRGTPQGAALSPLLSNIYLHPFDLALTSQGLRLVRFMDDFVVMCASQAEAERTLALVERQLGMLRLSLNRDKTRVIPYGDGLEFLGQVLAPRRRGTSLAQAATSFAEAEQALRATAGRVRRTLKRK